MTELDFLPEWYKARRQRRQGYLLHVWLGVSLLAVIGLYFYMVTSRIREVRADLLSLKSERTSVNEQLIRIDKLRAVRDDLVRKSTIAAKLHNQPDAVLIIDRLAELLPGDIGLVSLEILTETMEQPKPSGAAPAGPVRVHSGGPAARQPEPKPEVRQRYRLCVTGVAPQDVSVATFIARLSACPLFGDVHMIYSRNVVVDDRVTRQFSLACNLPEHSEAMVMLKGPSQAKSGGDKPKQPAGRHQVGLDGER